MSDCKNWLINHSPHWNDKDIAITEAPGETNALKGDEDSYKDLGEAHAREDGAERAEDDDDEQEHYCNFDRFRAGS